MALVDRVRAVFGMGPRATFDEPRAARFSQPYQPINALIEGLMRGIGSVGRTQALGVPAVKRGRDLICSISTLPLEAVDASNRVQDHPLLRQVDSNVANSVTLAMTVEDLLFEAVSWWRITGFGWDGYPVSAVRYEPGQVSMNPPSGYDSGYLPSGLPTEGQVWMAGEPVPWSDVIRFDSPNPALLVAGQRAIARAIALDKAADLYAGSPQARGFFTPADPNADPGDDADIIAALDAFATARGERLDGYVPAALKYNPISNPTPAELQLVEMQRRADLQLANLLGIDPEDVGVSTTSRTYANATDRRKDRINDTLAPYMKAVTDRLSMPDVTKRGVTVRFSLDDYLKADPKTRAEVQQIYAAMGVTDAAEVRAEEGLPPRAIEQPAPEPRRVTATVGDPVQQIEAGDRAELTFARETGLTFDSDLDATFAVDTEARTITGLAVPYGQTGRSAGRRWRFAKGSIKYSSVNRVKLLRDHDNSQAIGKAIRLEETDDGLVATFQVSPGPRGDEALALALDGVLDGLSIGVDFRDADFGPDPENPGAQLVRQAALREVSLTAVPSFDDSRLTSVRATRDEGETGMPEETTETVPAEQPVTFSADQFAQFMAQFGPKSAEEERPVVNPTTTAVTKVNEPLPYRFDREGNFTAGDFNFSTDLRDMGRANDQYGVDTDAGRRVMDMIRADFATVASTNVSSNNPTLQRPDMFVDQRDFSYPLWDIVKKGTPPNGIQPFMFPKYNSSGTLVADHVEGTEPTAGAYTTTNQTVTPTALSGKASLTREVWDMGGNPAVSQLIRNQMKRSWFEGLETASGTFLNTLTAATDINLGVAVVDDALADAWEAALADLMYVRGGSTLTAMAIEQYLYKAFVKAEDSTGRPLYAQRGQTNANGASAPRFRTLDLAGVTGLPTWGLGAGTGGAPNNSWLFDPLCVWGWATAPQYLEFPGTASGGTYAPLAMVDIGVWGYKAFANTDISGVRQVIYDNA
jgi:HK97 family phage prohead protease